MFFLNLLSKIFSSKTVEKDLSYGNQEGMKYDLYPSSSKKAPVVIFWYGGSWQTGEKSGYCFVGSYLQRQGYNAVIADYPKYPDQTFPGFTKDARKLIAEIRQKFPKSPLFLCGHSSGGHTALISAMKLRDQAVDGVIALSAPNWFSTANWPKWEKIFDDPYESKKQETYSYVEASPKTTRYLLVHGAGDVTVSPKGSEKLNEFLLSNGIKSTFIKLGLVNHYTILGVFLPGVMNSTKLEIQYFIEPPSA